MLIPNSRHGHVARTHSGPLQRTIRPAMVHESRRPPGSCSQWRPSNCTQCVVRAAADARRQLLTRSGKIGRSPNCRLGHPGGCLMSSGALSSCLCMVTAEHSPCWSAMIPSQPLPPGHPQHPQHANRSHNTPDRPVISAQVSRRCSFGRTWAYMRPRVGLAQTYSQRRLVRSLACCPEGVIYTGLPWAPMANRRRCDLRMDRHDHVNQESHAIRTKTSASSNLYV